MCLYQKGTAHVKKDPVIKYFDGREATYVLGLCRRKDEGRIGYDVQYRPVRLGLGEYTFVCAPDSLEDTQRDFS